MKLTAEQLEKLSPERRMLLQKMLAERNSAKRASLAPPDIRPRGIDGPVPLSFAQQRLWFIDQLEPGTAAYNMPFPLRLRGGLDGRVLERALGEIARRHESLRTVFGMVDGEPVQTVLPPGRVRLPTVDLRGLREDAREREAQRLVREESGRPFDLARGPLLRSTLLRLADRDSAVLFTMHHIVSDGWSMGVLVSEVSALYAAFAEGLPSPLPELPLQYPDYALWQREHLAGARLDEQIRYWKERLADAPPLLELPTDRPRPPAEDPRGAMAAFLVPEETVHGLRALTRSEGGTMFVVLLAGLQALLARYSGQEDVLVGSPIANRTRVELEGLIGFFVNTLVMRTDLSGDPTASELVARVRAGVLEAQSHQDLPFERLVEEVQPERSLAHSPLFQVLFTLQNTDSGTLELGRARMEPMGSGGNTAKFDLTFNAEERGEVVIGALSYRSALWDAATIRRMLDHYVALLAGMAADPGARVWELDLLTGGEREQVVRRWNATEADYPAAGGLRALFEAQAARTPAAPAAVFGAESLTYAELDRRAAALAARLRALGAGPDARVGLCVERSLEMVVGVLGIIKAGAAYVPIDPAYPEDRVAYVLEDAGISVLLTQERLAARLPAFGGEVVLADTPHPPAPSPTRGEGENDTATPLPPAPSPARGEGEHDGVDGQDAVAGCSLFPVPCSLSLAYVIYTSGSTGRPKGVAMPQRPLLNLLAWQLRSWHGAAAARTLQFASISFDVSFQEIFSTWASGGTLLVVPEEVRTDMARLARFLAEARVERIFLPFIALQHLAEAAEAEGIVPGSLREVVTAGEQLRVTEPIRRWLARMPGCALVNQYGPSETHVVTALALAGEPEAWPLLPAIGGPIANTQCYVLDRGLRPAPVGIPGELFLGGDNVARGYLGRPELTAEKFVPDPFAPRGTAGARLYRTGDRARWLAGGEIEFLGRTDQQVKVRGFRIEPGEVEAALEAHPAVREAVVVVREDAPGDRRLVAYLVAAAGEAMPGGPELRAWLAGSLPEYMVPAAFVALESLPLTPSGKLHRRALPAPDAAAADEGYVAPRTPAEATLAGIFAAVLRRERVGVHDGFFALGGHSLLATRVASRVRDAFGAELPLRALFEAPTVAALAERIERIRGERVPASAPIPRREGGGPVPLSFAQQRLWFIDRMEPGSAAYNMPAGLRLGGQPDGRTLERTLTEVVRRHESLRTVFGERGGEPVQTVLPAAPVRLPVVELGGLAPEARERELRRLAAEEAARPFDLARGPLLRSALLRLGGGESAVLFTLHHVVSDGWSMGVLVNEVSALYAAFAEGRPSPLPELPVQYPDYAVWQRARLTGEVLEAQLAFWRGRLAGAPPVLELPTDRPRPPVPGARGDAVPFLLPDAATRGLRALARGEGTTLFGALLAGFAATLARWSGQDDVVVGTPVAGRTRSELEGLIGFFVNTLALRTELGGDPTLRALVGRARETVLGAQAHQDVPFERLVEELQPERSLQHTPLFQVMLALQNNERGELRLGGLEMAPLGGGAPIARFDLELSLAEEGDRLGGSALFRAALWDRATVARMMDHLRAALEAVAADPDRRLSALELLTGEERAQVLGAWSAVARAYPAAPAHLLFAAAARRAPDAVALVFEGGALTYAGLDARSDALALRLRGLGVGPETPVGLCVERTPEMVVGVLGIWKAGGAYVPLDPAYPTGRLELIARDAALRVVVASAEAAGSVPVLAGEIVMVDGTPLPPAPSPARGEGEHDGVEADEAVAGCSLFPVPCSLAYVIYTSGSTGTPKGVLVEHGSLSNLLHAAREAFGVGPGDVMPSLASFAFDIWLFEAVLPLTVGATVRLVARERVLDPARLVEEVEDATLLHAVPALMRQLVREVRASPAPRLAGVRRAFVGGDLVPPDLLAEMRAAFPRAAAFVTYGPTEAAVLASSHRVPAEGAAAGHRIGAPLGNVRLYVCDAAGGAQPVGVPGELRVGGVQVARGYLGRPGLTAERFVPDAFAAEPGARAYRSGDRVRWLPSGELEFLGRTDAQVKVRGFRIEPGEVEAVLAAHPAVREAAVVVREDAPGERRLVAYVASAGDGGADAAGLRAHLKGLLPEYMVPSAVVVLESLPLTPTGKVDRRALPAPEGAAEEYVAPRTPAEVLLAGIWAEVLRTERVGVHDDFFALGGHSLLATRVASRIRESFGVEVPLRALFEAPTVAELAPRVDAAVRGGAGTEAPPIVRADRSRPLPLSFAQQRLWFLDQLEPGSAAYNMPFPLRLRGALDARALRRALAELARRHEALRTVFRVVEGEPVQVVLDPAPFPLPATDLGGLPAAAREREAARLAGVEGGRPFDLARGPLVRAVLVRLAAGEAGLLLTLHHAVADGWSMGVLTRELAALYDAFARGEPSPLPEPQVQYPDYAAWQRAWLTGDALERQLAWWTGRLAGAPALLELPADRPRSGSPTHRGAREAVFLPPELMAGVHALARREGATLFMVLLAAFKLLLSRLAGQDDVVVGTPIAGRNRAETEGTVGLFVNTLALRTDLSGDPGFRELLARVREGTLGAFSHPELPFERIVEELQPERSLTHAPLFQVMFNLVNFEEPQGGPAGLAMEPLASDTGTDSKYDLTLYAREEGGGVVLSLAYAADLFGAARMREMLEQLRVLLAQAAADPERPVGRHSLRTPAALAALPDPALPLPAEWDRPVHERFAERARLHPERVAVRDRAGEWTYGELAARAHGLAHALRELGVGRGDPVAVYAHRGAALPWALLGVLGAGGAFVVLDPAYPAARLRRTLEAARPRALLHLEAAGPLPEALEAWTASAGVPRLALPERPAAGFLAGRPDAPPAVETGPDDVAYLAFTSGTTGLPRGIVGTHRPLAHFVAWQRGAFGLAADDRFSLLSGLAHDPLLRDVFTPLSLGASIHVPDPEDVGTPGRLSAWMAREGVTAAHLTPAMGRVLAAPPAAAVPSLRLALWGGEAVTRADVARLAALAPAARSAVFYGATETPQAVGFHPVEDAPGGTASEVLPVGRGIDGVQLLVLTPAGEPAGIGEVGEICVRTPYLARGYLGDAEATRERFVTNPATGDPADRVYRTGDRGRHRPDGAVDFLGRMDAQVQVRGFRVEPGEVEAALAGHPGVREAVVVAREDAPGEVRLAAYVVPAGEAAPDAAALRAHLRDLLPEYMVPAAFVALERIPLTPNGKLDRRALPEPDRAPDAGAYQAPRTPTEEALAAVWAGVLGLERVGAADDFFALGGHSLVATRVMSRAREAFGVELPLRAIFEAPTVAGLAARVDGLLRGGAGAEARPIRPRATGGPVPLSFAQQRLWLIQQMDPASAAYNLPYPLRLRGALDVAVLERALTAMVERHESLRTVFAATAAEPVQVVCPAAPVRLPVADLSGLPEEAREAEARRLAAGDAARPFDLARGPLLRATALRLDGGEWGLLFDLHHIVSDGWSTGVLTREVSALYGAFARGEPSPLAPLPVQYADFALWQRERLGGEALDAQVRYWRGALAGAPPLLELPADRPRPAAPGARGEHVPFAPAPGASAALRELGRREGATPFIVLLAAFQALLARWSGQDDVSVGTPTAGRDRVETEGLIGFFVNTLVLRTDLSGGPSFRALLGRAREAVLGAFAHQDVPFEKLVEELAPERSLRHTPLFQVMFALQNMDRGELSMGGLEVGGIARGEEIAKFDLSLNLAEDGDRFGGAFTFRTDLFERATVERMADHFGRLLEAVAADPDRRLSEVEILGEAERARVLEEWSAAAAPPVDDDRPVHEIFAAQAARTPAAVAVRSGADTLTYAGLDALSDRLAAALRGLGVGPETRVGLCVERGPGMLVGVLGILKAGGAYVALDPDYPAERLAFMLADVAVPVLVAPPHLAAALPEHGATVVAPDGRKGEYDDEHDAVLPSPLVGEGPGVRGVDPDDLAYVIYTSGSTGRPKGVRITHRALTNTLLTAGRAFGFGAGDEMPSLASFAFDIWLFEALLPLLSGASVRMVPRERVVDVPALVGEIESATLLHAVPALMRQVVEQVRSTRGTLPGLRRAFVGGDAVPPDLLGAMREAFPAAEVRVLYGPTEATIICAAHLADGEDAGGRHLLGRPIGNAPLYVLDPAGRPTPIGVPGELCIGGAGVARDYLGRPELTAAQFVPDPFGAAPGARLYRTGDRARWGADGVLEFLGRLDSQVKIRGFRIEPGEVEAQLAAHPAVREAVVLVREDAPGGKRLVGYVVPAVDGVSAAELREHLAGRLPEYMVPGALVVLESFPLSPNGKVDRKALPAPEGAEGAEYVAPRTPTEEILAAIWAEVLRAERVGVHDDFFALGGHSLLATQVIARAAAALGVEIPLRALFEAPTVAGLAERADAALREGAGMQAPPIVPTPRDGSPLPLSFAQQRLWFIDQLEPGGATYNMPFPLRLRGALDVGALEAALSELVRRHESLRTVFATVDGEPAQVIRPAGERRLETVDLRGMPEAEREAEARRLAGEDAARPFDLARGPLLRTTLVRTGEADHTLLANVHHIVSDGWSMGVLTREVSALYGAFSEGRPSPLPELEVQYADYAAWQRGWLTGEALERQVAYWKDRLGGAPPLLELPVDRPRPAVASDRGAGRGFVLPAEATAGLRALSRREGATLFAVLLSGFAALLSRWAGEDDVLVGTPIAGRARLELEGVIGMFVNTLVLRTRVDGGLSFRALLGRVRETTLGAFAHQDVPFEKLVEELAPERSLQHTPLFQVMFALQNADAAEPDLGGLRMEPLARGGESAKFDLSVSLAEAGDRIAGGVTFRTDLFDAGTIERMLEHFGSLLAAVAADPDRRLDEVEILGPAERARVLEEWSAAAAPPVDDGRPVHEIFAAQAARTPAAAAVRSGADTLTYAGLDALSDRLAAALRGLGVGPETRVGLCVERGTGMLVGVLGILKAGGAYVPLDPDYPAERLAFMLADAAVPVLVAPPHLAAALPAHGAEVVDLDDFPGHDTPEGEDQRGDSPLPERGRVASLSEPGGGLPADPDTLAYVIYTSGSTGRPKGVRITHRALTNTLLTAGRAFGFAAGDEMPSLASFAFDIWLFEALLPLLSGASVRMVPRERVVDVPALVGEIESATLLHAVPALMRQVVEQVRSTRGTLPGLRRVFVGGDAVPPDLLGAMREAFPAAEVRVLYGPTEAAIICAAQVVRGEEAGGRHLIGRPIGNAPLYVLDPAGRPTPVGVPGELCIGGAGVARDYLGRPELTAAQFVPDPFGAAPGARLYRTGDRARWGADGVLEFLGRVDAQVKIRGFRIEPGEVEAQLAAHPAVREAVVLVREDAPGGKRLVGYVVPSAQGVSAAELREHLAGRLPEYMVPGALVVLEGFPLSPNGKVDRRALPAPEGADAAQYVAPRTPTEEVLAGIWAAVLGVERVGVHDGFFALGGHSLVATRVISRVREALGAELPLRALFEAPTVAGLAGRVDDLLRDERTGAGGDAAEPSPERQRLMRQLLRKRAGKKREAERIRPRTTDGPVPLSFAQQRLWFIQQMDPASSAYNMPFPLRLRGPLDPAAMRRALTELVGRHESLRTVFAATSGEPVQVIRPAGPVGLPVADLSGLPDGAREGEVRRLAAEESARPFDLARGPLLRASLVRLAEDDWGLVFNLHHIVSDGWSMGVLTREVTALYDAFSRGLPSPLAPLAVQYPDYAVWQRERITGAALDAQVRYWRDALAGAPPVLELPLDRPRPPAPSERAGQRGFALSAGTTAALRELSQGEGVTSFITLLAAFQALMARWSGQDDVSVGTPVAGRGRLELEGVIGMFVNTLVLRTRVDGGLSFRALLGRVRETALGAFAHQDVPFEKLVEELAPERSLRHTPLFQVMFALQNAEDGEPARGGPGVEPLAGGGESAKFDLSMSLTDAGDRMVGGASYRAELFDDGTIERMLEHFGNLLAAVAADPDRRLDEVEILGEAERARVLEEWNAAAARPVDDARPVHEIFAAQAARTPAAVAVRSGADTLTYAELDARSDRLAAALRGLGVGPETRVGLCVERGPGMLVGVLGILKAGGGYVPLDPDYPAERLAFMLADAAVPVLVAPPHLAAALPAHSARVVDVDATPGHDTPEGEDQHGDSPLPERGRAASLSEPGGGLPADPDNLAYVIYTSGSTGRPKGVRITHRALTNTLLTAGRAFGFAAGDEMPSLAGFAFDIWLFEALLPLLVGGSVRVVPRERVVDVAALVGELGTATMLDAVPALMRQVVEQVRATRGTLPGLRRAFVGGDAVPPDLLGAMREAFPHAEVRVMYGPTEATILCAAQLVRGEEAGGRHLIGRPIGNAPLYVLDPAGRPAPVGVPGELCIGGVGVARDYLGRPELTAAQFVPDPFGAAPGARLYRTGDRARWGADGILEFLGRVDAQVKIRGFRIEPGEVEAQLAAHPGGARGRGARARGRAGREAARRLRRPLGGRRVGGGAAGAPCRAAAGVHGAGRAGGAGRASRCRPTARWTAGRSPRRRARTPRSTSPRARPRKRSWPASGRTCCAASAWASATTSSRWAGTRCWRRRWSRARRRRWAWRSRCGRSSRRPPSPGWRSARTPRCARAPACRRRRSCRRRGTARRCRCRSRSSGCGSSTSWSRAAPPTTWPSRCGCGAGSTWPRWSARCRSWCGGTSRCGPSSRPSTASRRR